MFCWRILLLTRTILQPKYLVIFLLRISVWSNQRSIFYYVLMYKYLCAIRCIVRWFCWVNPVLMQPAKPYPPYQRYLWSAVAGTGSQGYGSQRYPGLPVTRDTRDNLRLSESAMILTPASMLKDLRLWNGLLVMLMEKCPPPRFRCLILIQFADNDDEPWVKKSDILHWMRPVSRFPSWSYSLSPPTNS